MSVNFMHPSFTGRATDPSQRSAGPSGPPWRGPDSIDWRAARHAARACCCPAKPAVIAVIPARPGRNHPTDLLLCGHHYRVSRKGLAAAGATVLGLNGAPVVGDAWPPAPARRSATASPADRRR
jgi:hypothetical protein